MVLMEISTPNTEKIRVNLLLFDGFSNKCQWFCVPLSLSRQQKLLNKKNKNKNTMTDIAFPVVECMCRAIALCVVLSSVQF